MDRQIARIEDQLIGCNAIEMEGNRALQRLSIETHVKVEIEVANTNLFRARVRMNIHAFHGKIIPSPPPNSETRV